MNKRVLIMDLVYVRPMGRTIPFFMIHFFSGCQWDYIHQELARLRLRCQIDRENRKYWKF